MLGGGASAVAAVPIQWKAETDQRADAFRRVTRPDQPACAAAREACCRRSAGSPARRRPLRLPPTGRCSIRSSSPRRATSRSAASTSRRRSTRSSGARSAQGQPMINLSETLVRVPGRVRAQPAELRAGPADQLARLRRARDVRRARRAALPGRHSGDDAGRPGPDRQLPAACRRSASRCCAARSRRSTATRRAA